MKVALGVTGCIAAYKAIEVMRGLQKAGVSVQVILTRSAREFVAQLPFEALSQQPVITDMFRPGENRAIEHIRVAQESDLLAVVPATANIIGKFAAGIADDFLSTLYLSCPAPALLAPAMNVEMWNHPAVRHNVSLLAKRGVMFIEPESGELACGMQGEGRLAAVDVIVSGILRSLARGVSMTGLRVLVTAGPTIEDIDPVRFISNRSSGKMGYSIARAASMRQADVVLVSGPTDLPPPAGVQFEPVRSAEEMYRAVLKHFPEIDILVMAAAVSDYSPATYAGHKLKKRRADVSIDLKPTRDILLTLGQMKARQVLVGFAAETENLLENAREKMERKNLDFIVANDAASGVFGADSATVQILRPDMEPFEIKNATKLEIAGHILDEALRIHTVIVNAGGRRQR